MSDTEHIIATLLQQGGIVVMRTDTLYGIIGRAEDVTAVERIYTIKGRQSHKPSIQLVTAPEHILGDGELFMRQAETHRDRPTSIIIDTPNAPNYLTRGGASLAYRLVRDGSLFDIIEKVGPLVAPSANPEGAAPARTITEARTYFGDSIDMYVDGGEVPADAAASRLLRIAPDGSVTIVR